MPDELRRRICGCTATAALLLAAAAARAQAPVNPLRTSAVQATSAVDPWAEPAERSVLRVSITDEPEPLPPPSVVPKHFGEAPPGGLLADGPPGAGPHDSFVQPWFTHTDPNDPYRHVGLGRPLIGTSWLNRPWFVGVFLGGLLADDLIGSDVQANNSFFIGGRLGWDFDHYWGLEGRYAYSHPQLTGAEGDNLASRAREYYADVSLAYYPWGDSQWRPFVSCGLGLQTFRFRDHEDRQTSQSLLSVPIGGGLKLFHSPTHTLRLEAYDNIALGDGRLSGMSNFTLAIGAEFRFGGRPTSYFPWHGTTALW